MAEQIVKILGPHRVYWEPFCGSMAVLMAKPHCVMETVNDLNGELVNLARVVQNEDMAVNLFAKLGRTLMSEQIFKDTAERYHARGYGIDSAPDLEAAYDYCLCAWLGRNGVAGTSSYNQGFCVRYTANGGHAAKRFQSVIESIPAWFQRLRNVTILCRDAFDLIPRIEDKKGTAIYVDPPYLVKGAKYVHDFKPEDHIRLAEMLQRFTRSLVVVSYYADPQLEVLYPKDRWAHIEAFRTKILVSQSRRGKTGVASVAPEMLLVNNPTNHLLLFEDLT